MSEIIHEITEDSDGVGCYIKRGEVVRCKDCRWYERPEKKIFKNCCRDNYLIPMKPNDYCSYGERREDGEA